MPILTFRQWLIVYIVLFTGIGLCVFQLTKLPDGKLHFYMFDVGQGDSQLLVSPSGKQILVDGGPNLSALAELGKVMPLGDRSIDLLVLSHPHLDHMASFPEILRRYDVGAVMMEPVADPPPTYKEMLSIMKEKNIRLLFPDASLDIDMGDGLVLDVVWPGHTEAGKPVDFKNANNTSVAFRALYKDQSILFTGDMELPEEAAILKSGMDIDATVLKAAHHGSRTSSSTGWILASTPNTVVISVGARNTYKHPSPEILRRFALFNIPMRLTEKEGTISMNW